MANTLSQLWKAHPGTLEGKSFFQVIQLAGDGKLLDGNKTSTELREWLSVIPLDRVRSCAEDCLKGGFADSGLALQDVVNEIGVRLDFKVSPGLYRGAKNVIGHDGIWNAADGFCLLLEVKTTDAYRINLETVSEYRRRLIGAGKLDPGKSSILIAVGRQDTGDLEAQIRGSQQAWDVRLISVEALLRLAEVKVQLNDWSTSNKISQLLRPVEYTRLDGIVELLFATKQDLDTPEAGVPTEAEEEAVAPIQDAVADLERARDVAVQRIEAKLGATFVRRGKALRASSDSKTRLVCLISQRYDRPGGDAGYWHGFTRSQHEFIKLADSGFISLVCGISGKAYLVPRDDFMAWLPVLNTTPSDPVSSEEVRHWHVRIHDSGDRVELIRGCGDVITDLGKYTL